eukprot:1214401-Prorocentrum_lima.AAC.1
MFGSTSTVEKIIDVFKQTWKCRVAGIIPRDECTTEEEVSALVFLGMVVELVEDQLVMHERPYLENKLKKRGLLAPNFGK